MAGACRVRSSSLCFVSSINRGSLAEARAALTAPGNQGELSLPSRDYRVVRRVRYPVSLIRAAGKIGLTCGDGGTGRGNVIKSAQPQKPQRRAALGSSSKFTGLDWRCSNHSAAELLRMQDKTRERVDLEEFPYRLRGSQGAAPR